jgi:tubulin delta
VQVASHPTYRLLTLRTVPQVDAAAAKFCTFNWDSNLKRLLQMYITRTTCSEQLDWAVPVADVSVRQGYRGVTNKAVGSFAVLRGTFAAQVDARMLANPSLYAATVAQPLQVAAEPTQIAHFDMSCTMLSSDQVRCWRVATSD